MKHCLSLAVLVSSLFSTSASSSGGGLLQYCNHVFFCTSTKKEPTLASAQQRRSPRAASVLNFCTDMGENNIRDCEVFKILGTPADDDDNNNVECRTSNVCKHMRQTNGKHTTLNHDGDESMELTDLDQMSDVGHVSSWRDRPKRGRCYDNSLAYEFDCNLVEILDDGLVLLIEDLTAGGIFAAQPKSSGHFSTSTTRREARSKNKSSRRQQVPPLRTPEVITAGSGITTLDPVQDYRTNVSLNLEGL